MNKAKIMVVDDEELVLRAYKKELTDCGYNVIVAATGEQAIEISKKEKIDIIFLDLVMPGMNGVETCRIVKAISPETEVVLMSGYLNEMQKNWIEFIKAGGRDYFLRKPAGEKELIDTIKTILIGKGQGLKVFKNILVIDDESIIGRAMQRILEAQGYYVAIALSGEAGVMRAKEKDFQMAIVDLVLPGMDGLKTCEELKEVFPKIKLVMMSGYVDKIEKTKEAFKAIESCAQFMEKPFGGDEVVTIANNFFEKGAGC